MLIFILVDPCFEDDNYNMDRDLSVFLSVEAALDRARHLLSHLNRRGYYDVFAKRLDDHVLGPHEVEGLLMRVDLCSLHLETPQESADRLRWEAAHKLITCQCANVDHDYVRRCMECNRLT